MACFCGVSGGTFGGWPFRYSGEIMGFRLVNLYWGVSAVGGTLVHGGITLIMGTRYLPGDILRGRT